MPLAAGLLIPALFLSHGNGYLRTEQGGSGVVGGVGWLTPASIAYKVPSWVILGGFGAYNAPENLFDAGKMDLSKLGYAMPDEFCRCRTGTHNCKKDISNHAEKFAEWLGRFSNLVS